MPENGAWVDRIVHNLEQRLMEHRANLALGHLHWCTEIPECEDMVRSC